MGRKIFTFCCLIFLMVTLLSPAGSVPKLTQAKPVEEMAMFQGGKFDAHYRVPHDAAIELLLREEGVLLPDSSADEVDAAINSFMKAWSQRNPTTPNPEKFQELLEREQKGLIGNKAIDAAVAEEPQIMSFAVPVEFPNSDTFVHCGEEVTTVGPLHNEIPAPGPRDNNTVWYEDTTPEMYNELYFGVGPDAGIIVNHPNLGEVDLRGSTMANYYIEQSKGVFVPKGSIFPQWVQAAHSEGWYGADGCEEGGSHNVRAHDLVREVIDQVNAIDPDFPWQDYDGDADGEVDNFTVIHAGMGQEGGGGYQGDFAIWSHASMIDYPTGYQVCVAGSAGCPDRDIVVYHYSMDPENIDIGVISEEFGHAAFGLPDIYTNDYNNSVSNWAIMSGGSWNGPLGGMLPAPFPLWFRYLLGWSQPVETDYDADPAMVVVGQHSLPPDGTADGIRVNLPPQTVTIENPLGTGNAWWSDVGNLLQNTLARPVDLTAATAPVLSFASHWSIEEDWDYGYVEVSTDDGATWTILQDMDGIFRDTDPNGNNEGWGLTGEGEGTLNVDLAAYAGQTIWLRLRYSTDPAAQGAGWWVDDLTITDGDTVLFADDCEAGEADWTFDGWRMTPLTNSYTRYYLAEWRNLSGFDRGLVYPYQTVYYDEDEWEVDRTPYSVPGMVLWLRNAAYAFDYTLGDSWYNSPSWGAQHALLVVDSHFFPLAWDSAKYASGAYLRINSRSQSSNAAFQLQDTTPFTIRLGYDPATGAYLDEPIETKTFEPQPGKNAFHDSLGYYPGLYRSSVNGRLYWWDIAASAVIPAAGDYTTRITDVNENPFYPYYGADMGGTFLGSGNPGDDGVQFGLHLQLVKQADDGSWGAIAVYNSDTVLELDKIVDKAVVAPGGYLAFKLTVRNNSPIPQKFVIHDPIPANTQFIHGMHFNAEMNAIHWEGNVAPYEDRNMYYIVQVLSETPGDAVITNTAYLFDGALGDVAETTTTVMLPAAMPGGSGPANIYLPVARQKP